MHISPLTKSIAEQYVEFKNLSAKESTYINSTDLEKTLKLIEDYAKNPHRLTFVLMDGSKIVGQLFLELKPKVEVCHISLISVLEECYGKGAAKQLIDKTIEIAKHEKLNYVELIVNKANDRAIAFYTKMKFKYDKDHSKTAMLYRLNINGNDTMNHLNTPPYLKW